MSEPLTLTRDEIRDLTGLRQYTAQARALARLGIPFERRSSDGSLIVGREAARQALHFAGNERAHTKSASNDGIRWSTAA